MLNNDNEISAILVTGGVGGKGVILNTVELFHMNGTRQCSLPNLKSPRRMHSQTGLLACGNKNGMDPSMNTCESYDTKIGNWTDSHTMQRGRFHHSAWKSPHGVMLLGGGTGSGSLTTAEVLDKPNRVYPIRSTT